MEQHRARIEADHNEGIPRADLLHDRLELIAKLESLTNCKHLTESARRSVVS